MYGGTEYGEAVYGRLCVGRLCGGRLCEVYISLEFCCETKIILKT